MPYVCLTYFVAVRKKCESSPRCRQLLYPSHPIHNSGSNRAVLTSESELGVSLEDLKGWSSRRISQAWDSLQSTNVRQEVQRVQCWLFRALLGRRLGPLGSLLEGPNFLSSDQVFNVLVLLPLRKSATRGTAYIAAAKKTVSVFRLRCMFIQRRCPSFRFVRWTVNHCPKYISLQFVHSI